MTTHQLATTGTISGVAEQTSINALAATLATMAQGSSAPTTTSTGLSSVAGLWWHNTSTGQICVRDQGDTTWIPIGTISETGKTFTPAGITSGSYLPSSGGTVTGLIEVTVGGVKVDSGGIVVISGGANITGNITLTGNSSVSGASSVGGNLSVTGGISAAGQIVAGTGGVKFVDGTSMTTAPNLSGYALTSSLSGYAPLASPALTGSPTATTPATTDNSTRLATTAMVQAAITAAIAAYAAGSSTGGDTGGG